MFGPKTRKEAKNYVYGSSFLPNLRYEPERCAYPVSDGIADFQCSRKPGHGPDGIFCKQHAAMLEKEK